MTCINPEPVTLKNATKGKHHRLSNAPSAFYVLFCLVRCCNCPAKGGDRVGWGRLDRDGGRDALRTGAGEAVQTPEIS